MHKSEHTGESWEEGLVYEQALYFPEMLDDVREFVQVSEENDRIEVLVNRIRNAYASLDKSEAFATSYALCKAWNVTIPWRDYLKKHVWQLADAAFVNSRTKRVHVKDVEAKIEVFMLYMTCMLHAMTYIFSGKTPEERQQRAREITPEEIDAAVRLVGIHRVHKVVGRSFALPRWTRTVLSSELSEGDKTFMRRMYANNYEQTPEYASLLLKNLEQQMHGPKGKFVFLEATENHSVGYIFVQEKTHDSLALGALNLLQPFQQMQLVHPFIVTIIRDVLENYDFSKVTFTVVAGSSAEKLYKQFSAREVPDSRKTLQEKDKLITRYDMELTREQMQQIGYWQGPNMKGPDKSEWQQMIESGFIQQGPVKPVAPQTLQKSDALVAVKKFFSGHISDRLRRLWKG